MVGYMNYVPMKLLLKNLLPILYKIPVASVIVQYKQQAMT